MKSDYATCDRGGGRARARAPRAHACADAVLREGHAPRRGVVRAQEDARTERQLRTGQPVPTTEMTDDIIDRLPAPLRWAVYVLLALTMTGIIPALLVWALEALCAAVGSWPVWLLLAAEAALIWRAI